MWGAELINHHEVFGPGSLTGSGDSLYVYRAENLARIDPATGAVVRMTPYDAPVFARPAVLGNTVWLVWSYKGGDIVLRGYDARTLAQVASIPVPAIGGVSDQALGVLAAGPDGKLYLAAGDTVVAGGPGHPPGDAHDLPDRGPGHLGGDRARREASCTSLPGRCHLLASTTPPPA